MKWGMEFAAAQMGTDGKQEQHLLDYINCVPGGVTNSVCPALSFQGSLSLTATETYFGALAATLDMLPLRTFGRMRLVTFL